ncbi:hypothetical protein BOX15_Mlig033928g1, partial [Macrostomum lignano]
WQIDILFCSMSQQYQQQDGQVTIVDAIKNVNLLDNLDASDTVYSVEAAPIPILLKSDTDRNFQDRNAYVVGVAKYLEEATVHAEMTDLLKEGEEFAVMLYTWRSCSRALPQIRSNEQSNKNEIHEKTIEVLQQYANRLMSFMLFHNKAIGRFCEDVKRLCLNTKRQEFVSEAYLLTLGKMLNMFAVLDELKNMKASMKNDYSHYKRAAQFLRRMTDPAVLHDAQTLTMFLAEQNKIRKTLKDELQKIEGFEDLFAEVINTAVMMYENRLFLYPSEKHLLVKVIGFSIFIINTNPSININKMDAKRRICIAKIDAIFKQCEVVNLYGDMSISPFDAYVSKSQFYDPAKWPECRSARTSPQGQLFAALPRLKQQHAELMSELATRTNLSTTVQQLNKADAENRRTYELALKSLSYLGSWSLLIVDVFTWKLAHLTDVRQNPDMPKEAEDYAKATQYNYSREERFALVEVIAMIKSVQAILLRMETILMDSVKRAIYYQLQDFVQRQLREPLRKAAKNKREIVKSIIMSIRTMATHMAQQDSGGGSQLAEEFVSHHKKSGKGGGSTEPEIRIMQRNVPPSSTQLYMVRTMLESLIDRSGGKHTLRKDVDPQSLAAIDQFHRNSYFWPYLLNYSDTLQQCCDLSQLWYREFFLEMTNGAHIQFDIDMSVPWLLTKQLLDSKDPAYMEYLLYPLDLYNDSAFYALTRFRRQFLYDEIEAEANLGFDQLVICLSKEVFAYYKTLAASILLDKGFRTECNQKGMRIQYPAPCRYETLINQRHVQLLGRSIDLNRLIGQRANKSLLASLQVAVQLFESRDITGVIELEQLIEVSRLTHKLLQEAGLQLDDFDQLFSEANEEVTASCGKVTLHCFWELQLDFVPHYCYNSSTGRFVKSTLSMASESVERAPFPKDMQDELLFGNARLNKAFGAVLGLYDRFVGPPHFSAMCRLLGYNGIGTIVSEMLKAVRGLLDNTLCAYLTELRKLMPKECKLQRFDYTSPGILGYYCAQLRPIVAHPDLRTEVFQAFREFGNTVLACLMMEQSLTVEEVCDLKHAAAFQETIPKPFVPPPKEKGDRSGQELRRHREEETSRQMKRLQTKFAPLSVLKVTERVLPDGHQLAKAVYDCDLLTKERLCCGLCIFETVLSRVREMLNSAPGNRWLPAEQPRNGVMFVDECQEYHRVWSAMQFAYCIPPKEGEFTVEELYGEGLQWAGCCLLVLLGEERRFELLDYSYHLLKANKFDQKDDQRQGFSLKRMADRIRKFQILNAQILATLDRYVRPQRDATAGPDGGATGGVGGPVVQVRCYDCPRYQLPADN